MVISSFHLFRCCGCPLEDLRRVQRPCGGCVDYAVADQRSSFVDSLWRCGEGGGFDQGFSLSHASLVSIQSRPGHRGLLILFFPPSFWTVLISDLEHLLIYFETDVPHLRICSAIFYSYILESLLYSCVAWISVRCVSCYCCGVIRRPF